MSHSRELVEFFSQNFMFKAFVLMPLPTQEFPSNSCHNAIDSRKLLIPPDSIILEIFPLTADRGRGNYDLLYQKYEDDLEN